jgi:hypothetical protein
MGKYATQTLRALQVRVGYEYLKPVDAYHKALGAEATTNQLLPKASFTVTGEDLGPYFIALSRGAPPDSILSAMQDDLMGKAIPYDWPEHVYETLFQDCTSAPAACRFLHKALFGLEAPWQRVWLLRSFGLHAKISEFRAPHAEMPRDVHDLWLQRLEAYPHLYARPRLASLRDLQDLLGRLKTRFNEATISGVEAKAITGRMNAALGVLVDRDLHSKDFSVDHWGHWYHTDGRLRRSRSRGV